MPCPLNGGRHPSLILQGISRDAPGQQFALLIHKLDEKIRVLVIDVFDAELAETAIFFPLLTQGGIGEEFDFFL